MATKRVFKVAKKLSGAKTTYRKWAEWAEGDIVIGKLLKVGEDQYQKPNYMLEVEDAQLADKKLAKELIGKNITLNSSGMLDKAMAEIELGKFVQITYNGTAEIEKGKYKGKDSHVIEVDLMVEEGDEDVSEEEAEEEDL